MILTRLSRYGIPVLLVVIGIILMSSSGTSYSCVDDGAECYEGTITKIIDGDTIKTNTNDTVRLSLVLSPELSEEGGIEAKEFIESICPVGSNILVDEDNGQQKSFDRTVAQVHCNGKSLNAALVENNHGIIDKQFCYDTEFIDESWTSTCDIEKDSSLIGR